MVELDTNSYEKKFWLSEKQLLSEPVKSVYPKVTGSGSIAYVVYSSRYSIKWHVNRTYSVDFGANWSGVYELQETGSSNAGHPFPIIHDSNVCVTYSADKPPEPWQDELLFRHEATDSFIMSESTVIDMTSGSSSEAIGTANLLTWLDTLFCLYLYYDDGDDGVNYIKIQKSFDLGESWVPLNAEAGTAPGRPLSCLLDDTVMSIVHRGGERGCHHAQFRPGVHMDSG
jgi:hypothetical protein